MISSNKEVELFNRDQVATISLGAEKYVTMKDKSSFVENNNLTNSRSLNELLNSSSKPQKGTSQSNLSDLSFLDNSGFGNGNLYPNFEEKK